MSLRRRVLGWFALRPGAAGYALVGPGVFWLLVFFLAPIGLMPSTWW